jgi:3-(methylthio)propionyl---CoA ligase
MLPNIPDMLEYHFGVPVLGGVQNALTTRLDAEAIAFMLEQGEARVLIADREYGEVIKQPVSQLYNPLKLVDVNYL